MPVKHEIDLLAALCTGKGANIGCGNVPIANSIGVDVCLTAKAASVFVDSWRLPFSDNSLDYIVSCASLEHMEVAPVLVLREWARCLRVHGTLGIIVPDAAYGIWSMTGDTGKCGQLVKPRREMEHLHAFTVSSLKVLLEFAGFTPSVVHKVSRLPVRKETTLFAVGHKNETYK